MWESLKGTTDGHQKLVKWVGLVFISYLLMRICKQHQQKLWGFFSHWIPSLKRITEFSPGDIFRDQLDQHHLLSSFISHFVYPFTSMDRSLHLKFSKHINTGVGISNLKVTQDVLIIYYVIHLCLSSLKFQGKKHIKYLILSDLNAKGAWCVVGWRKGKTNRPVHESKGWRRCRSRGQTRVLPSLSGSQKMSRGLITWRSRRGAGCYNRPSVF